MFKPGLPPWAIKLAYKFVDLEASGEAAIVDSRVYEYSFAIAKIASRPPGFMLDVGCTARINPVPAAACELRWKVWGVDLRDYGYKHRNFIFIKGDITGLAEHLRPFGVITVISALEHVGMTGRYGIKDGHSTDDFDLIRRVRQLLEPKGSLVLTVPYTSGRYREENMERVYDADRVDQLVRGMKITDRRTIDIGGRTTLLMEARK